MEKELLKKYVEARMLVDSLDEQLKKAKTILEDSINDLHEDLTERGACKTAVYEGLGSYSMGDPTLYASVDKENEKDLFSFLNSQGREDLIKPSVHHRSLATFIKESIDNGVEIPQFIKTYYKPTGRFYAQ